MARINGAGVGYRMLCDYFIFFSDMYRSSAKFIVCFSMWHLSSSSSSAFSSK